jgi:hypothetical protein
VFAGFLFFQKKKKTKKLKRLDNLASLFAGVPVPPPANEGVESPSREFLGHPLYVHTLNRMKKFFLN